MGRGTTALVLLLTLAVAATSSDDPYNMEQLDAVEDSIGEAITIKLNPLDKRNKGEVSVLANRFKTLPELRGVSIAAASRDLMVLIPTMEHSIAEIKKLLLQQPEVYELEVGEKLYRREGDKPYDQLRKEKLEEVLSTTKSKVQQQIRDKLRKLVQDRRKRREGEEDALEDGQEGQWKGSAAARKVAKRMMKREAKRAERKLKRELARSEHEATATAEL